MKLFMAIINATLMITTLGIIIILLATSHFDFAWLMVLPAAYSGANFWAITSDN